MAAPVVHGAFVPQGRPATADGVQDGLDPGDAQEGVLLPGEARLRQILRGRRGTHRDERLAESRVGGADGVLDAARQRSPEDQVAQV
ncbi:MAG TPA: hypothetical protein PLA49_01035, partial [Propioniciclava sp.]|uniref:hypothetical protein n=1 Tax=Propioniciclava sp. TaxID=2038686 RepID=UPI002C1A9F41